MKYQEFESLSEYLETKGSSINEIYKDATGDDILFEADEEELTATKEKVRFGDTLAIKYRRLRKKLTNNGKEYLKKSKEQLLDAFEPKNLETLKKSTESVSVQMRDNKNPEEIKGLVMDLAKNIVNIQKTALQALNNSINELGKNYKKFALSKIEKTKMSEKRKLDLTNYWELLSAQVKQICFKAAIEHRETIIKNIAGDNQDLADSIREASEGTHFQKLLNDLDKNTKLKKEAAKKAKDEAEAEETGDEESTETGEEETGDEGAITPEVDKYYEYLPTGKTDSITVKISEVKDDGTILGVNVKKPGTPKILKKENLKKEVEKPARKFQVGETYSYTSKKGAKGQIKIVELLPNDQVKVASVKNPKKTFAANVESIGKKLESVPTPI